MQQGEIRFVANGLELVADHYGDPEAPAVLLSHGGGQTRHSWRSTSLRLAEAGFYVVNVDLRGHGDSDWSPTGDYDFETIASDLGQVAEKIGRPTVFVGASLGGVASFLAIAGGLRANEAARALVLVDIGVVMEAAGVERIQSFMLAKPEGFASIEEAAEDVARFNHTRRAPDNVDGLRKNLRLQPNGRWMWHWDPQMLAGKDLHELRQRLERSAPELRLPVLLVRGSQSDVLSEAGVEHFLHLLPHADVARVPSAGHMIAGDDNDSFNEVILDFLSTLNRPRETGG